MWESFTQGLMLAFSWKIFAMMSLGMLIGILVGALPGFTTVMAMAILLPISFFMPPLIGIPFLIALTKGGIYGGSIPAILISIPGTGAAVATTFDGPALAKKGEARKAMEMALFASVFGDLSSDVLTLLFIGPIALIALRFGPPELTAIVLLSLIIISATASGALVKGLIMGAIGLLFSMVGQDPLGFMQRFTFDIFALKAGIPLLPMLIGVFAIPEILLAVEKESATYMSEKVDLSRVGERLKFTEFRRCFRTILRSTGIGSAIGACPGVGQVVAAFIGYAAAVNASSHPETFGKGELEGVAAAEAANNAVNGPTLVPLLTLGIPGDNVTAIMLGAFIAHGIRPGPQLMSEQGPLVFGILMAMVFANILFVSIGYVTIPFFARIVTIRKSVLLPLITIFAFAGSYVYRSDPFDLIILAAFGGFGYVCRKLHFDISPMVMAFILGPILEYSFGQTLSLAKGNLFHYLFIVRPIAGLIFLAIPIISFWFWRRTLRKRKKKTAEPAAAREAGV
ncbi:MAG: C4-dicarboxylate ABC transporter permease [Desulfobacteraceae bacterium]|nr:MAG: C4-dicarboxylate ABC transporter permease [Desulfobacteraceae bacterium]